jgi:hypothetical protein
MKRFSCQIQSNPSTQTTSSILAQSRVKSRINSSPLDDPKRSIVILRNSIAVRELALRGFSMLTNALISGDFVIAIKKILDKQPQINMCFIPGDTAASSHFQSASKQFQN